MAGELDVVEEGLSGPVAKGTIRTLFPFPAIRIWRVSRLRSYRRTFTSSLVLSPEASKKSTIPYILEPIGVCG